MLSSPAFAEVRSEIWPSRDLFPVLSAARAACVLVRRPCWPTAVTVRALAAANSTDATIQATRAVRRTLPAGPRRPDFGSVATGASASSVMTTVAGGTFASNPAVTTGSAAGGA